MEKFHEFYKKYKKILIILSLIIFLVALILPLSTKIEVKRDGVYTSVEDVSRYIKKYHELPSNYLTKAGMEYNIRNGYEFQNKIIGGDNFYNDGSLSKYHVKDKTLLKECDIYQRGYTYASRGAKRIVYTSNAKNVKVFYTDNHYESYKEISGFSLQLTSNILWIFSSLYFAIFIAFYILVMISHMMFD